MAGKRPGHMIEIHADAKGWHRKVTGGSYYEWLHGMRVVHSLLLHLRISNTILGHVTVIVEPLLIRRPPNRQTLQTSPHIYASYSPTHVYWVILGGSYEWLRGMRVVHSPLPHLRISNTILRHVTVIFEPLIDPPPSKQSNPQTSPHIYASYSPSQKR